MSGRRGSGRPGPPTPVVPPGAPARDPAEVLAALGVDLDPDLLRLALTHRSYAYENGGLPTNERLEFLGDAVLGLVVTETLYRTHPDLPEGRLAKLRASVVNMRALAAVARGLGPVGLGPHLLLGRGEQTTGGADKDSILADAVEALLGAVHVGLGPEAATALVHRLIDGPLSAAAAEGAGQDWKTALQELCSRHELGAPAYRITESGPDHAKQFTATALVAERTFGEGHGTTKKQAEQEAAAHAHTTLQVEYDDDGVPGPDDPAAGPADGAGRVD